MTFPNAKIWKCHFFAYLFAYIKILYYLCSRKGFVTYHTVTH